MSNDYTPCVHFIGFTEMSQFQNAVNVFGKPDFVHRFYDNRAKQMIVESDVAIFANGHENKFVEKYSYDDSAYF